MKNMSRSAKTVLVFGVYVMVLGTLLLFVPNVLLRLFRQPETSEIWIRAAGMLLFLLGFYYIEASRSELTKFFQFTVYGRISVLLFFLAFVLFLSASPILLAFGAFDFCGAIWTQYALKKDMVERTG
jgi:hypothetical protein